MINVNHVSKRFSGKEVLTDIHIQFKEEQTHVILGSSGCGKSTLLRILMGLTAPSTGTIEIQGEVMSPATQRAVVRKIGYVVQDGGLFPHLTAAENSTLVAKTLSWSKEKIETRLKELANLVEFECALLSRYPKELSGGQRQRVGLMRALFLNPSVLLLDEPLGALDPIVRATLQHQLKAVFNQLKKTVLIVTHDIGEAAYFGHTITLMNEGKIVQHGTFQELAQHPATAFVSEFINAQKPPPELKEFL
jgi:osmoprotectant transport system ATP-binding protein